MSQKQPRDISPYSGGVFSGIANRIKLIWRLMSDPRVSPLLKLLPITSIVYLLFPDVLPGPVDDAAIIWLSTYLFVELCPPDVVLEHLEAIERTIPGQARDAQADNEINEEDIIDGEIIEGNAEERK
jgi:hypothetical protein